MQGHTGTFIGLAAAALLALPPNGAGAEYAGWRHSGVLWILTTPEGADIPAAAAETASIWIRIPKIAGNARQEIKMYWGKADAKSESSGTAVFNAATAISASGTWTMR